MAIINIFCDPSAGTYNQSLKSDPSGSPVAGSFGGTVAYDSSILGGPLANTNSIFSPQSTIVMGQGNSVPLPSSGDGGNNFIGNGDGNVASGFFNSIFNGGANFACSSSGVACYATVVNGVYNTAEGQYSFIGSGGTPSGVANHVALGDYSFIGNGQCNFIGEGSYVNVFNGQNNQATGCFGTIVNGSNNCICEINPASPLCYTTIGNGNNNMICSGNFASIFAGADHVIQDGTYGSIVGGLAHRVFGEYATIAGGCNNYIDNAQSSFIGAGELNFISARTPFSAIAGGCCNNISNQGGLNFIGGGFENYITGGRGGLVNAGVIAGGSNNTLLGSQYPTIGGGCANTAGGSTGATVAGGATNCANADFSFIGGGGTNAVNTGSMFGAIAGGNENNVGNATAGYCAATYGFIGGGQSNLIDTSSTDASSFGAIGGGQKNTICAGANNSGIFGGEGNSVASNASFILGGVTNCIVAGADCSTISGGCNNSIGANSIFGNIVSGYNNKVGNLYATQYSSIFGGLNNVVNGQEAYIGGGQGNVVYNGASNIYIGAGFENCILAGGDDSSIMSGAINKLSGVRSFIGSGDYNTLSSRGSSIVGGNGNTVSGDYSAILGGQGNNDNGFTYTGMYGVGLNGANIPSGTGAFWANELVIPDIPAGTGGGAPFGYPLGSLYYLVVGGLKQVYVV